MGRWTVHVVILALLNVNVFIQCGSRRQSAVCLKELQAFTVTKPATNASSDSTRICSSVFGCCNKSVENEMKFQINKKLKSLIYEKHERVKTKFKDVYNRLKVYSEDVLQQTSESAVKFLQSKSSPVMANQVAPHIRNLFKDLQNYVTRNGVNIEDSTDSFFKNFYLAFYENYIPSSKPLPKKFAKCLMDKIHMIKPFHKIPRDVSALLMRNLQPPRVFLHGLQFAGEVLEYTNNVKLSQKCSENLVRMSYCSLCDGFQHSKPCLGYCVNVTSLCLEPYTDIQRNWNQFILTMGDLLVLLPKALDGTELFSKLQMKFMDSINYALKSELQVYHHCGNVTRYRNNGNRIFTHRKKQKDSPARDIDNGDLYLTDSQNSIVNLPTASDVKKRLIFIKKNLSDAQRHFIELPLNMCKDDGLAASDDGQDSCWVGTGVGSYNASSMQWNTSSLKPVNSDRLKNGAQLLLQTTIDNITNVIKFVKRIEDESDRGNSGSGSGSGSGDESDPHSSGETDDEDDCENEVDCPSGSGSGSGETTSAFRSASTKPSVVDTTTFRPGGSGTSCQCSLAVLVLLLCWVILVR